MIFRNNGNHLFNIKKPLQKGIATFQEKPSTNMNNSDLDINIIQKYDTTKKQIYNVVSLNDKTNLKSNDIVCVISVKIMDYRGL